MVCCAVCPVQYTLHQNHGHQPDKDLIQRGLGDTVVLQDAKIPAGK